MAELFQIMKVTVGEDKLCARVLVNPGMPIMTSEDIEATARVYYLAPAIATHACLGDAGELFQDCMGDTEVAHLLEHLSVEIMHETGLAGEVSSGRTRRVPGDERLFDVELACPDDALAIGALSSAAFMMQWAFVHPDAPAPDFEGTVRALAGLVASLRGEAGLEVEVSGEAEAAEDGPDVVADGAAQEGDDAADAVDDAIDAAEEPAE